MSTRIGINGFGRMGRLALRAAWGWPDLEFVHINEIKGGAETAAHLLDVRLGARPLEARRQGERRTRSRSTARRSRSPTTARPARSPGRTTASTSCSSARASSARPRCSRPYFDARREEGHRRRAREGGRAQRRRRRQRPPLRARQAPPAHRGLVHDELPRAGREGDPRGPRHPARRHHDDPRHHEHAGRDRRAAQGSAPRAREQPVAHPDEHRLGDRDRAHLSRAEGQAERHRRARAAAQRLAHRLRVRGRRADDGRGGQRAPQGRRPRARSRASSATRSARSSRSTSRTIRAPRSSTRPRRWSSTAPA